MKEKKKILILCPSPRGTAATQRLKYEQYLPGLEAEGYRFTISSFQTKRFWKIVYKKGRVPEKAAWTFFGYLRRFFDLLRAPFYDAVFVNLWVTPLGLPAYERLLFLFNSRVIYDIDDMLFIRDQTVKKEPLLQRLKGKRKPLILMRNARYVITCTPSLHQKGLTINKYHRAVDISSTFDTERFVPVKIYTQPDTITIGWTGTHSTLPFLDSLQPVLMEVSRRRKIRLFVIANKEYQMEGVPTDFRYWSAEMEIQDLHQIDIGLYPIPANEWSLGKSSLKALTYMSIGIPFVATAYGTNFRIMENGVQGYLASTHEEWVSRLIELIDNVALRERMGKAGRKRVLDKYSVEANLSAYLQVFNDVCIK